MRCQLPAALSIESLTHHSQALDLLDASAAGDIPSTARLTTLLSRTPAYLKRPPKRAGPKLKNSRKDASRVVCVAGSTKAIDARPRPAAALTGVRKVPKLVNANALPILRWKKPQPESLSRVIRDKVNQKQRRMTMRNELQDYGLPMGQWEDEWDRLVREQGGGREEEEEPRWAEAVRLGIRGLVRDVEELKVRGKEMARRMAEIVERERELAEGERRERLEKRRAERAARRGTAKVGE